MNKNLKQVREERVPFVINTHYQLFETGRSGVRKPLLVYLHGYKQNIPIFKKKTERLHALEAYHLYIKGPYPVPIPGRKIEEWGAAWYLYDGDQHKFIRSLEQTSSLLQEIVTKIRNEYSVTYTAMIGYSMGGYQGGYFGIKRPDSLNDLIIISARIKDELIKNGAEAMKGLNIFAIHGEDDESVQMKPQKKSINNIRKMGINASFKVVKAAHHLTDKIMVSVSEYLKERGYK